jgi:hypothetical protein
MLFWHVTMPHTFARLRSLQVISPAGDWLPAWCPASCYITQSTASLLLLR